MRLNFIICELHLYIQVLCNHKMSSNCEADQHLCFLYTDSAIPLLLKSEISSFKPSSVAALTGFCQTWSETPKTVFSSHGSNVKSLNIFHIIYMYNSVLRPFHDHFRLYETALSVGGAKTGEPREKKKHLTRPQADACGLSYLIERPIACRTL